jgi:uncharacterized protein YecE (DUF72 family)
MTGKKLWIGTSGWSYDGWKTGFYAGVPRRRWLQHCAEHFDGVEVNMTFYRIPKASTLEKWRDETPPGFRFAIKALRAITHLKKLHDVDEMIATQRQSLLPLKEKISVILWQLPSGLHGDPELLKHFIDALRPWRDVPHAFEFRHTSWFQSETLACLEEAGIANVISHAARWPMWDAVSGKLVYIRLHGAPETYASAYSDEDLGFWAARIRQWLDEKRTVHVYFDNDALGHAPYDALKLRDRIAGAPGK